ncbi:DUF1329 domain-containing protein [Oceaniserpentilla sp. 4NH20-0058]|uniref:DUF1329 domain-containing protein n=1 Tax=Oceaniserpentilla sp. 4NH20-0058 TaxID=3127660 RepID=UPI003104BE4F
MKLQTKSILALALAVAASGAMAKVSPQEAAKLGKELTPMGAEKAGNKAGTIPAWTGGLKIDSSVDPLVNIFANEKPLFTITAQNVDKHKANLTAGQIALFAKYPETYTIPVYKTHRTVGYPQKIYDKVKSNATSAVLAEGGNGILNFDEVTPFPIPQNGMEAIWNHTTRYRGGPTDVTYTKLAVQPNGSFVPVTIQALASHPNYVAEGFDAKKDDNILAYYMQSVKAPARLTGNVLLVHETLDQIKQPRMAWTYNAGQRRVRRAPQVAYDAPSEGAGGMATADQTDMYNGSPTKYDWKILGKKEVYIPYNGYKLATPGEKYSDMLDKGHVKRDYMRYELHRVWVVEATLKAGERHIYGKRTFFMDEDSWQIALVDQYDSRGELWRASENFALHFQNQGALLASGSAHHDLLSGGYLAALNNEEDEAYNFDYKPRRKDFTTSALRRSGKR